MWWALLKFNEYNLSSVYCIGMRQSCNKCALPLLCPFITLLLDCVRYLVTSLDCTLAGYCLASYISRRIKLWCVYGEHNCEKVVFGTRGRSVGRP